MSLSRPPARTIAGTAGHANKASGDKAAGADGRTATGLLETRVLDTVELPAGTEDARGITRANPKRYRAAFVALVLVGGVAAGVGALLDRGEPDVGPAVSGLHEAEMEMIAARLAPRASSQFSSIDSPWELSTLEVGFIEGRDAAPEPSSRPVGTGDLDSIELEFASERVDSGADGFDSWELSAEEIGFLAS